MENIKLNIRALAALKKISIPELAKQAGIDPAHLANVSVGRATFTARDLAKLLFFFNPGNNPDGLTADKIDVENP